MTSQWSQHFPQKEKVKIYFWWEESAKSSYILQWFVALQRVTNTYLYLYNAITVSWLGGEKFRWQVGKNMSENDPWDGNNEPKIEKQ